MVLIRLAGDNLAEYFTATWGVESLSACQASD